ncbi:MAG: MOSC N-terminal beta barrel domain-containing protein [Pseudomonadota bacterium]
MTAHIAQIWRHPIKAIGAERLDKVRVAPDRPLPLDRAWAVLQDGGEAGAGWRACRNFVRGAKGPSLMAISARVELASQTLGPSDGTVMVSSPTTRIRLSHPDRPDILVDPARDGERLIEWLKPIYPDNRPAPAELVRAPVEGMSDAPFASISVLNLSSLRALGQKLGQDLDPRRFRGNFWVDGWAPWEEFDLVGKSLSVGGVQFDVVERITRCRATEANPATGRPDAATLLALEDGWGHRDFGVYVKAAGRGQVEVGSTVRLA